MTQQNVWIQNFSKLRRDIMVYDLSFPNQFDIRKLTGLEQKENKTDEEKKTLHAEQLKAIEIIRAYRNNQQLPPEVKPESMCTFSKLYRSDKNFVFAPIFMIANGYILVTEEFATLLKQFNLGTTQLLPINYYDLELEERFDDKTYYLLNVCEAHSYFLPEIKKEERKNLVFSKEKNIYFPPRRDPQHKRYYFLQEALTCPVDLWYDPNIVDAIFLSDRLVKAIKKAGMQKILSILPCQFAE